MKSTKELIQEIHDSFDNASNVQLLESQERIENLKKGIKPVENEETGRRMMKLGFTGTNISRKVRQSDENNRDAKIRIINLEKQAKLVIEKNRIDPVHKFITEDKVEAICEKYNLLHGPAHAYIGDVPIKNLEQIENFKLSDAETMIEARLDPSAINAIREMNKLIFEESFHSVGSGSWPTPTPINKGTLCRTDLKTIEEVTKGNLKFNILGYEFSICAPQKDFNTDNMEIRGRKLVKKEIPDPVVLCKVDGGYRIVTAWGLEANDPEVINPINN